MEVIDVLGSFHDRVDLDALNMYMPYIPISLSELLACPWFSPHSPPRNNRTSSRGGGVGELARSTLLAKSIAYQVLNALPYLHHPSRRIVHQDIKPDNTLLNQRRMRQAHRFWRCVPTPIVRLPPFRSFSSIVGPNGSGEPNNVDSLPFVSGS